MTKRNSRFGIKKIIPVLLIFFLLLFTTFGGSKIILVKEVDIKLQNVDCATTPKIKEHSTIVGQNILLLNKNQIEENLRENFICIKEIKIKRIFFDKVTLEIIGRTPKAVISAIKIEDKNLLLNLINISTSSAEASMSAVWNLSSQEELIVDEQGVIFSQQKGLNLPRLLFWDKEIKIGQNIDQSIINKSIQILEKIKILGISSNEARIYSQRVFLINAKPKLIFSLEKDIESQLAALQLIIEKAKIGDEQMEMIDLRFDNPIIRYGKR